MFSRNEITSQQSGNRNLCAHLICVLISLALIGFGVNSADAASLKAAYKYQKIKALSKSLKSQKKQEDLEKLVEKSSEFVEAHPEYKRVDEVYYLLGNALVQLERVEEGITVFEEVIKTYPEARYVERCLLDLGLAYDKLDNHDAADNAYQKLIDHPKYGSRSQAKLAKKILEQDKAERMGELPKPPGASLNAREWIGKPALDFQGTDLKGEELSLKQYRGQVVLLDFWATWCPPCLAEIPNIKKTYERYKDQKFQIIGISLDRSMEPLKAYIKKEELGWLHYWDKSHKVSTMYKVQGIPATFLIDGDGIIRKANLGGFDVESAVAELVKENLAKPADASDEPIRTPSDSPEGAQNAEPKVKEIIEAAIAAHGGLEKLQAVKSVVMQSESFEHLPDGTLQNEGRATTYFDANRIHSDWWGIHPHSGSELIFDGKSVFMIVDGEVKPVPSEEAASYANFFRDSLFREPMWLLTTLSKDDLPVQYIGTAEVKGVPTSVLLVTQPSGKKLKVFISEETHYVVQFSYDTEIGGDVKNVVAFLDDYRDVDGIKIPYYRATENGEYRRVFITDITLNAQIDEALFHPEG